MPADNAGAGNHQEGCVLRDDHHAEPCLTALPPWWDPDCFACIDIYCEPRYDCEDLCMTECIGACGAVSERAGTAVSARTETRAREGAMFGPEYPKIQTTFKRDERNVIIPGDWSVPEFEYLANTDWHWTEKVDGTNIRLHWNGDVVTIGGRTDNAQVPSPLVANLGPLFEPERWREVFPDADDVTVYGEGYGAKIQSGGMYRQDQAVIVFDVLVGPWWLSRENVTDVAAKLGLDVVPVAYERLTLADAVNVVRYGGAESRWEGARIEGLVGRPSVDLFNRKGERIMAKVKVKDFTDYERRRG